MPTGMPILASSELGRALHRSGVKRALDRVNCPLPAEFPPRRLAFHICFYDNHTRASANMPQP